MLSTNPVVDRMMVAGAYVPVRVLVEVSPQQWKPGTTGRLGESRTGGWDIEVHLDGEYGVEGRPRRDFWSTERVVLAPEGACGYDHEALKLDDAAWERLDYVGLQHVEADAEGPAETLELRNCACGSTLCREIATAVRRAS